jgi:hypothetical protein
VVVAFAFVSLSALLAFVTFAASPAGGTITPSGPTLTWAGTASGVPPAVGGESDCVEGSSCDSFKLTISGTPADWAAAGKQVHVEIDWTTPSTDYDLYIHKGALTGPVVASSGSGGTTSEQVDMNPSSASIGTGDFIVHVVYFASNPADQYHGTAKTIGAAAGPVPAPAPTSGLAPRYERRSAAAPANHPSEWGYLSPGTRKAERCSKRTCKPCG